MTVDLAWPQNGHDIKRCMAVKWACSKRCMASKKHMPAKNGHDRKMGNTAKWPCSKMDVYFHDIKCCMTVKWAFSKMGMTTKSSHNEMGMDWNYSERAC